MGFARGSQSSRTMSFAAVSLAALSAWAASSTAGDEATAVYRPAPLPSPTSAESRARAAGAGNGSFQITLDWSTENDLDLHLETPCGLAYFSQKARCNARLDVDMNVGGGNRTPVEHFNGEITALQAGHYRIFVHQYALHGGGSTDSFNVLLRLGAETKTFSGTVSGGDRLLVYEFDLPLR